MAAVFLFVVSVCHLSAQSTPPVSPSGTPEVSQDQPSTGASGSESPAGAEPDPVAPGLSPASSTGTPSAGAPQGQQTKRILGILPNFQAVSADTHPPPLSVQDKFWLATEGTFDYSSFISAGIQAAVGQALKSYPEFHEGAAAYGRYYWHTFADAGVENYLVGSIFPVITREDPRYYTLDRGGFFRRVRYAMSRLWITRKDAGGKAFNFSEILGSGSAAEVSSLYYPRQERGAGKVLERWTSQFLNDGVSNIIQEFWPDIHDKLVHRR
jgi:hypothetical protein